MIGNHQALKNTIAEQMMIHRRMLLAMAIMLGLISIILFRFFYLQIVEFDVYKTKSDSNRVHLSKIPPKRGLIFDSEDNLLAENLPSFYLAIVRDRVDDLEETLAQLQLLGIIDEQHIKGFKERKYRYRAFESMPLRFNLNDEEIAKVVANRIRLPGVEVKANLARNYPYLELTAHALGYVGRINERELKKLDVDVYGATTHIGKLGVEKSYEDVLHGTVGFENVETNARGEILRTLDRTAPIPGADLTLHLDLDLQKAAMKALSGRRGAVVALNTKSGGVIVAASSPSFNPNLFSRGISHKEYKALRENLDLPLYNRFLQAQYPPGSTIKPIMSLAGLNEKVINKRTIVPDPGWYQLPTDKRLYRDWKREGHGDFVGFTAAIEQSCDVYYYDLAYKLGVDKIHDYYARFGLGEKTGIDLPGERKGLNPSQQWKKADGRGSWFSGDSLNIGIGQGFLLATPLQLAYATNIIANRGERLVPQMVARVGDEVIEPVLLPRVEVNDEQYWKDIHDGMVAVIHGKKGTGKGIARRLNYKIAGKTGTAQVVSIAQGEKYDAKSLAERKRDHALFVGYAPAENPEITIAVLVENGGNGSTSAAPIARKLFDLWMQKLAAEEAFEKRLMPGAR